jgi:hypothetical protein
LGSSDKIEEISFNFNENKNYEYHQIHLGFVIDGNKSRWLTHQEISDGVIRCIRMNTRKLIVGTLTPWDKRP